MDPLLWPKETCLNRDCMESEQNMEKLERPALKRVMHCAYTPPLVTKCPWALLHLPTSVLLCGSQVERCISVNIHLRPSLNWLLIRCVSFDLHMLNQIITSASLSLCSRKWKQNLEAGPTLQEIFAVYYKTWKLQIFKQCLCLHNIWNVYS